MRKKYNDNILLLYLTYVISSLTFSGCFYFKPGVANPRITFIALFFIIGVFYTIKNIIKFTLWMFTD